MNEGPQTVKSENVANIAEHEAAAGDRHRRVHHRDPLQGKSLSRSPIMFYTLFIRSFESQ